VSGGFTRLIAPVAGQLHIPTENIHANVLLFDEHGNYDGFDTSRPTSETGKLNSHNRYN
jgi:phosphoserine phosphatase